MCYQDSLSSPALHDQSVLGHPHMAALPHPPAVCVIGAGGAGRVRCSWNYWYVIVDSMEYWSPVKVFILMRAQTRLIIVQRSYRPMVIIIIVMVLMIMIMVVVVIIMMGMVMIVIMVWGIIRTWWILIRWHKMILLKRIHWRKLL